MTNHLGKNIVPSGLVMDAWETIRLRQSTASTDAPERSLPPHLSAFPTRLENPTMPIRNVPGTGIAYYLVAFDKHGNERSEDGQLLSDSLTKEVRSGNYTDAFVFSHGWKGDIPAAVEQYDAWITAMLTCTADRERARRLHPDFRPLLVGFHWPSLPLGNETLGAEPAFSPVADAPVVASNADEFVDVWAGRISDSPDARSALRTIFDASVHDIEPERMPPEVIQAYERLNRESGLGADGVSGTPYSDRERFDPVTAYEDERLNIEAHFGGSILAGLLSPLLQLSFWQMKARANRLGETGGHALLQAMRNAGGSRLRIHLMGHSFGCIVASSMVAGRPAYIRDRHQPTAERDSKAQTDAMPLVVDSLFLVQGALSLWSFCADIPFTPGHPGYFYPIIRNRLVSGPIVTTQSRFDTAVRKLYPKGAGVAGQVAYEAAADRLPKYGGVGTFGIRGEGPALEDLRMLPLEAEYNFRRGCVYNLDAEQYIRNGGGFTGAHNDIAHPEVAHAFWSAVLAGSNK